MMDAPPVPEPSMPPAEPRESTPFSWPLALLLAGFALVLSLLVSSDWQASSSRAALEDLTAYGRQEDRLDALLRELLEAESSVRGYLLSHDPGLLGPYRENASLLEGELAALRSELAGQPIYRDRLMQLASLIEKKRKILEAAVVEGVAADIVAASAGSPTKPVMDQIRLVVGSLRDDLAAAHYERLDTALERFSHSRLMSIGLGVGMLALLVVLFYLLLQQARMRQRLNEVLKRENAALESQVAQRTAELRDLATWLTNAREAERARIARELHDELGALLTAAKLDTGWIARKLPPTVMAGLEGRFERLQATLNQGIAIKRRVVNDLRPPLLAELGLVDALSSFIESSAGAGELRVETTFPDHLPELPGPLALALFRIAQEALTNVHKHAGATTVTLSLASEGGELVLRVEDNGRGFSPAALAGGTHGLSGMRHRVQMFAGRLAVRSRPGGGTVIEARIPFAAG
jgi:protein-histidine pros-kinase